MAAFLFVCRILTAQNGGPVVFILAGQSNMVGTGNIMDLPEALKAEQVNVLIYTAGTSEYGWTTLQPGVGAQTGSFGPEVTFGRDISRGLPGKTIALIKVAWSGSSLAYDWRPPSAGGTLGNLYTEFVDHVRNALNTLPSGGGAGIAGMCWMQGESDACNIYPASEYKTNLTCFINDVRAEFGVPQMPFVIAMIERTDVWQEYEVVREAQAAVAAELPDVGIFDCDGFPSDGSHYQAAGLILMGEAFADAMLGLLPGIVEPEITKGDVNGNGGIDIVDALLIARYYVGLGPSGFPANAADTDCNGRIDIVDALLVAQYYVGLRNGFC